MQTTPIETPDRRAHPYASLVDAIRGVLSSYYDEPWLSERAANVTMAIGEPTISLADVAVMLQASGDRPAASDTTAPYGGHAWPERCMIAGHIFAAVVQHRNRRMRLEAL